MEKGNVYVAKRPFTTPSGHVLEEFNGIEQWGKEIEVISWDEENGTGSLKCAKHPDDIFQFNNGDIFLIKMHYDLKEDAK